MSDQNDWDFAGADDAKAEIRAAVRYLLRDAAGSARADIVLEIIEIAASCRKRVATRAAGFAGRRFARRLTFTTCVGPFRSLRRPLVRVRFAGFRVPGNSGRRRARQRYSLGGCWSWRLPLNLFLCIAAGTKSRFPRDLFWVGQLHEGAVMGGLYLGIAVTGVNALVAMGLVIAFM